MVSIADKDGILDPTNPSGPYYGLIEPLLQIHLGRHNPVDNTWHTRFRGFIEEMDYVFDPSQKVNRLELSCVDLFEILAAVQMLPGEFGDTPTDDEGDNIVYDANDVQSRIRQVLDDVGVPSTFTVVFTGNVNVQKTIYSPGESVLTALQECADAEFPGVSNVYIDRFGRFVFHGRLAKFDPAAVIASNPTAGAWVYRELKAGDGAAVTANTSRAQIRRFAFNRGLGKIVNQALATPMRSGAALTRTEITGQTVKDVASVGQYGIRSWSAQDLLTLGCFVDDSDDLTETKRFATFYVDNLAQPRNRITDIAFRSIRPDDPRGLRVWEMLSAIDISDSVEVTVGSPGGGGFDESYFVEGVHEQVQALTPDYDDVTLTLDLSPRAYFASNPFPTS